MRGNLIMAVALYRKYRSKKLDDIIGQKHITDILSRAISQGKVSHAYLFTGPRGVGKTSVARILAHEINGLEYSDEKTHLDIIEIDAASNNGVEDVRDLREKVQIAPVLAKKKIYIIDEVHMLSKAAFNALLKTLEEPPEHIVFILATTNIEKIPATIISRAQKFTFKPIRDEDAISHLSNIAKKENIKISDDALRLIAERSDGSFRDSISLLDQLSSLISDKDIEISVDLIEAALGLASKKTISNILQAIETHDLKMTVDSINQAFDSGASCSALVSQLIDGIKRNIIEKPNLIPLLDNLIEVEKSPQPQIKLLSVLGSASLNKNNFKSAALNSNKHEISVTIAELEKKALEEMPSESTVEISEAQINIETGQSPKPKKKKNKKIDFDSDKFLSYIKDNHIAIYSVISKCSIEVKENTMIIYAINKFYKNKLDDAKYRPLLAKSLEEIGVYNLDIQTIPTCLPPKDSQAAAIAAIMGGGIEVAVEGEN